MSVTNDYNKEIESYFKDVKKYKPLPREEEVRIGKKIKDGDFSELDKLITSNLKFVISIAKKYKGHGVPFSDLISEGNIGLIKAASKYDYSMNTKFISYAVWWIRQSLNECIKKDISFEDNIDTTDNSDMKEVSIDGYLSNEDLCDEGMNFQLFEEEETKETEDFKKSCIDDMFTVLTDNEISILSNYFGLNGKEELTLDELGEKYSLTKERIRQIKERALRKMRVNAMQSDELFVVEDYI